MTQKNAILLGGPRHGKMVPIVGYEFWWKTVRRRGLVRSFTIHRYCWEYRCGEYLGPSPGTIFGVYVKPEETS